MTGKHKDCIGGINRTSNFASRVGLFGLRAGLFAAKELAVLSDEAAYTRNVCEENFAELHSIFIFERLYSLDCTVDAVRTITSDKGN